MVQVLAAAAAVAVAKVEQLEQVVSVAVLLIPYTCFLMVQMVILPKLT
jgi:hypothetical protein